MVLAEVARRTWAMTWKDVRVELRARERMNAMLFFAALVPSWFRSIMDHRVLDWAKGDLNKIQIEPGMREYYDRKFGSVAPAQPAAMPAE